MQNNRKCLEHQIVIIVFLKSLLYICFLPIAFYIWQTNQPDLRSNWKSNDFDERNKLWFTRSIRRQCLRFFGVFYALWVFYAFYGPAKCIPYIEWAGSRVSLPHFRVECDSILRMKCEIGWCHFQHSIYIHMVDNLCADSWWFFGMYGSGERHMVWECIFGCWFIVYDDVRRDHKTDTTWTILWGDYGHNISQ